MDSIHDPSAGDTRQTSHVQGLQHTEALALLALAANIAPPDDAWSGHALRLHLRQLGVAKLEATLAVQALVAGGLVARVRRDDADGRFYTAYRLTERGAQWLREHGDGG